MITYITFGTHYGKREKHPAGEWITGDGWVAIDAQSHREARSLATALFGDKWAFAYSEEDFTPGYYPAGELARYTLTKWIR